MKDGVILRVSKPARMGIDDAPLHSLRSPTNDELLPFEHGLRLIPALIAHGDFSVFCGVITGYLISASPKAQCPVSEQSFRDRYGPQLRRRQPSLPALDNARLYLPVRIALHSAYPKHVPAEGTHVVVTTGKHGTVS